MLHKRRLSCKHFESKDMEKTFYYGSFNISYSDTGKGLPVILLHGFGEDSRIWEQQARFLQAHCRLIIPDLPGSGDSLPIGPHLPAQIIGGPPRSIDLMAEAITALASHEHIDKCIVLGHSMGGYITLAFAEKFPEKLLAFGLIHSTAFADSEEKKANRRKGIEFTKKNGGYAFLQTAIPGLFGETFKEEQPGQVAALIAQFDPSVSNKAVTDAVIEAYYEAMIARPDRTEILKQAKVPVLFVMGKEDKAVPMADTLQQVPLPETSYVHVLERAAHMSMKEYPGLLNQYLKKFIEDIKHLNKS
jgi:pimeloyl-ACP methyl ester carboxylesterase